MFELIIEKNICQAVVICIRVRDIRRPVDTKKLSVGEGCISLKD